MASPQQRLGDWVIFAADVAVDSSEKLLSWSQNLDEQTQLNLPLPIPTIDILNRLEALKAKGLDGLANALLPPQMQYKRSLTTLRLNIERRKETGSKVGIGLIAIPNIFSYERRFGRAESEASKLQVTIENVAAGYSPGPGSDA